MRSRDEILDAALELFGAVGWEGTSVRELTRRLGVSHSLVHHYFRSKDALWRAAMDQSFGTVAARVQEAFAAAPPQHDVVAALRQAMVIFLEVTARYPANGLVIAREGARGGPRLEYLYTHYVAPNLEPWRALLRRAQAEGRIRADVDVRTLFFLLTDGGAGVYTAPALARRIGGPDPLDPAAIRAHAQLVADLLVRGAAAGAARARSDPRHALPR